MIRKLNQVLQKAGSGPMCCGKTALSKPHDTRSLGFYFFIIDTLFLPSRGSGEAQRSQHRNPDNTSSLLGVGWGMALRQHCIGETDSPGPHRRGVSALDSVVSTSQVYGPAAMTALWTHLLLGNCQRLLRISTDKRLTTDFPSMRPRSGNRPYRYPISIFRLYSHKATTIAMGS